VACTSDSLVNLHFFVMSMCPDAKLCQQLYAPVIEQVGSIVNFTIDYIATQDSDTESGFFCKRGDPECFGNMGQLCAKKYYSENYQWYDYVLCQIEDQSTIPDSLKPCAAKIGLNAETLEQCAYGDEGKKLLLNSITTTESYGITRSCTMYLENELFCIHDGGWQNCQANTVESIVDHICTIYHGSLPPTVCTK